MMNDNLTPPPERDFPEGRLRLRKEELLASIQAGQGRHARRPWMYRRAALVIGFAALAAAAIAAATLPATSGGPGSASAAVFKRLASRVAAQSWTPAPGQYLYLDTQSELLAIWDGNCEIQSVEDQQTWIGPDGSGLQRETKQAGAYTSPDDRTTCLSMAAANSGAQATLDHNLAARSTDDWSAPNCMKLGPTTDWASLSSDPQTLLQQIDQLYHSSDPSPDEQFRYVADILGQSDAPPDVQANIYRAAALIPGVQSLGTVQDHAGRSGLGLSIATPVGTSELIFDDQTGELLGRTDTGQLADWIVYLDKKVVNALPSDPPVPLTPACTTTGAGTIASVPGGTVMTGK